MFKPGNILLYALEELRSVLTTSAVGGLIAAGNIVAASAQDVETLFDVLS